MKKGKINLLSFEDDGNDEETVKIQKKSSNTKKETEISRPPLDLSQIKDRVIQMELDEEMVIEGEVAEALFEEENGNYDDSGLLEKIKEAKEKRKRRGEASKNKLTTEEDFNELPDYIPITTKGDYWLTKDTKESEEAFNKNSSRLVREDLFNEIEVDDASGAYTSFIGKSSEGRQGLMMTKKMLERDIKTEELYDLEMELNEPFEEINDDEISWEKSQILKGIEKGWNRPDDEMNFYSKQAKLPNYIPPPSIDKEEDTNFKIFSFIDIDINSKDIELNINRISEDSKRLKERVKELEIEIENKRKRIEKTNEIETFFVRYSRFLTEKLLELNEISKDQVKWEHFFDNVDVEDSDLLDLPDIINKISFLGLGTSQNYKQITELFIKYHFMAMDFDKNSNSNSSDPQNIWESSGLADALEKIENPIELLTEIFADDFDKLKLIESSINFKDL
jgi:hypothetical protein